MLEVDQDQVGQDQGDQEDALVQQHGTDRWLGCEVEGPVKSVQEQAGGMAIIKQGKSDFDTQPEQEVAREVGGQGFRGNRFLISKRCG